MKGRKKELICAVRTPFNLDVSDLEKLDKLRTTTGREVSRSEYIRSVIRQTFDKISVISENEQLTINFRKISEENKILKENLSREIEEKEALSKKIHEYESYFKSENDEIENYVQNARFLFNWILKDWDVSDVKSREVARPAILKHISRLKRVLESRNFEIDGFNEISRRIEG